MQQTLLVELFTEELPPKVLRKLGDAFANAIFDGLAKAGVVDANASRQMFASPRRLAISITNVAAVGADQAFVEKLMPVAVGLDKDGKATPALIKKLAAKSLAHIDVATLARESDGKAEQLVYRGTAPGQTLHAALQVALDEAIRTLPMPKVMSYQLADGNTTVHFVRPAHGLVALHGTNIVDVAALGLRAGRTTHGHRFQGAADIVLAHADEYALRLENEGAVIAGFDQRKAAIKQQLDAAAGTGNASLGEETGYADLLDEVTALVERPTVYVGQFEATFLEVPAECLILTMKLNQKYFPLFDRGGKLLNKFLIVSNMRLEDAKNIVEGNERVVRPRLSDAKFFFDQDRKKTLASRLPALATVVYHNKLGSQGERSERVVAIAKLITSFNAINVDAALVERAARLSKADLPTDMVGEFPELQGIMGEYYARHDQEPAEVAQAIREHYLPRFAGDAVPGTAVGAVVALADKLETVVGLFSIGQVPTGDKDPFGLRRHAVGILRILIEKQIALPFSALVNAAMAIFKPVAVSTATPAQVLEFFYDRLAVMMKDEGYSPQEVDAVVSQQPMNIPEVSKRLGAVREFAKLPEAESLAAANKRIGNILKKSEGSTAIVDATLFVEPAEQALFAAIGKTTPTFNREFVAGNYTAALQALAPLKAPVDAFFDGVMVNAEDAKLRNNRLSLLRDLHLLMNKVADLSKLAA
jgi:glycyl-tRNA synthetase beta chain